jgi:hypothetical protein
LPCDSCGPLEGEDGQFALSGGKLVGVVRYASYEEVRKGDLEGLRGFGGILEV